MSAIDWFNHNFDKLLMSVIFGALAYIYLRTHDASIQQLLGYSFTCIATLTGSRILNPSNGNGKTPSKEPSTNGPTVP